jgi:hypothetical protein
MWCVCVGGGGVVLVRSEGGRQLREGGRVREEGYIGQGLCREGAGGFIRPTDPISLCREPKFWPMGKVF